MRHFTHGRQWKHRRRRPSLEEQALHLDRLTPKQRKRLLRRNWLVRRETTEWLKMATYHLPRVLTVKERSVLFRPLNLMGGPPMIGEYPQAPVIREIMAPES